MYAEMAKRDHAKLVTFYLNVFGGWGVDAAKFVQKMSSHNAEDITGITNQELFYCMTTEIAVALQRANVRVFNACLQSAASAAEPVHFVISFDGNHPGAANH